MMVSCPGCNTSYSIDERKLPAGGGRLTCRECGHEWKIGVPSQTTAPPRPAARSAPPRAEKPAAAAAAASTASHSDSSGTLQKPVNCPKCGHYFVPYQPGTAPSAPQPSAQVGGAPVRRKILLVEDQTYFAELTSEALGESFDTTVASSPSSARQLIDEGQFDLVILDLSLEEGQDGAQVLQATRRRAIPVLIFTARDETELYGGAWEQLRAAGASDILLKGLNVGDELRQKVQSILGAARK